MASKIFFCIVIAIALIALAQATVHHYRIPVSDVDEAIFDAAANLADGILG